MAPHNKLQAEYGKAVMLLEMCEAELKDYAERNGDGDVAGEATQVGYLYGMAKDLVFAGKKIRKAAERNGIIENKDK